MKTGHFESGILGYSTSRSLYEGVLKLFFCVWFEDYRKDKAAVFYRKQILVSPEDIAFDRLIALYSKKGNAALEPILRRIQQRGNAIHHFCDHQIGTQKELIADILEFGHFILAVNWCQRAVKTSQGWADEDRPF